MNVRVHEDAVVLPLREEDGRRHFRRIPEIVVGKRRIARIGGIVFDRGVVVLHHLQHMTVVVHARSAKQVTEAFMRFRRAILAWLKSEGRPSPHMKLSMWHSGESHSLCARVGTQRKQLARRPARLAPP